MAKVNSEAEQQKERQVTMMEILQLQRLIGPYKQKLMQGTLVTRLNQYLIASKIITLVNGEFRILDAHGYTWWNKVEEARQRHESSQTTTKIDLRSIRPAGLVKTLPAWEGSEDEKLRAEALEALA